jgi:hypothetical protein
MQAGPSTDRAVAGDVGVSLGLLKHNPVVAGVARLAAWARNRDLERVIFTATTGRSGTTTLTRLFSAVPSCRSLHEPWPPMSGAVLEAASHGNVGLVRQAFRRSKVVNILRAAAGHRYYFEANHCFIKTFAELAFEEFGDRLAVVHLVRPAIEVAMSIFRLREEPGTNVGNFWWLDHRAPSNLIQVEDLLDCDRSMAHPFYKALWYWYEVEARIAALRSRLPSLKIVRFETADLDDKDKVLRLFADLEIACDPPHIEPLIGGILNQREEQKALSALPLAQAQFMLLRFHDALVQRGIDLSVAPAPKPRAPASRLRVAASSA